MGAGTAHAYNYANSNPKFRKYMILARLAFTAFKGLVYQKLDEWLYKCKKNTNLLKAEEEAIDLYPKVPIQRVEGSYAVMKDVDLDDDHVGL